MSMSATGRPIRALRTQPPTKRAHSAPPARRQGVHDRASPDGSSTADEAVSRSSDLQANRRPVEPVVEGAEHARGRAPDQTVLPGHGVEAADVAGGRVRLRASWLAGSIRKPNGVSKISATSSGLGARVKPGGDEARPPGSRNSRCPSDRAWKARPAHVVRRRPISSSASRRAVCQAVSPGSQRPPGRATCPV